jgi:hypothetical protein
MISSMIAVEAEHRPTFEKALSDFMADYVLDLAADHHVPNSPATNDPIAKSYGQADSIVSGICRDWDGIIAAMVLEHDLAANHTASDDTTLAVGAAEEFSGEDLGKLKGEFNNTWWLTSFFSHRRTYVTAPQHHHLKHSQLHTRIQQSGCNVSAAIHCKSSHSR